MISPNCERRSILYAQRLKSPCMKSSLLHFVPNRQLLGNTPWTTMVGVGKFCSTTMMPFFSSSLRRMVHKSRSVWSWKSFSCPLATLVNLLYGEILILPLSICYWFLKSLIHEIWTWFLNLILVYFSVGIKP